MQTGNLPILGEGIWRRSEWDKGRHEPYPALSLWSQLTLPCAETGVDQDQDQGEEAGKSLCLEEVKALDTDLANRYTPHLDIFGVPAASGYPGSPEAFQILSSFGGCQVKSPSTLLLLGSQPPCTVRSWTDMGQWGSEGMMALGLLFLLVPLGSSLIFLQVPGEKTP